jgi:hypothetical protein
MKFAPLRRVLIVAVALGFALVPGFAATDSGPQGSIRGRALNQATGVPMSGVTVTVTGTDRSTRTDLDGSFHLGDVPAGTYSMAAGKEGFESLTIRDLGVVGSETVRVDLVLGAVSASGPAAGEPIIQMETFSVAADVMQGSGLGLMVTRQRAVSVSDAIASDEMSRLAVGNAAEALAKMPGTSFLDGKYVVIRGLGDRYTNTQLNGATVPSADPDKRTVQLDQFPSDLLESINTLKSFTPDQPGAFSGGSVNIKTKSFPERFFFSLTTSTAYNPDVTGRQMLTVPGGGRDWLGRDDGTRALSSAVPNPMPSSLTTTTAELAARQGQFELAKQLDTISKGFHNEPFFPSARKARPDFGFGFSVGDSRKFGQDQTVGYLASFTYDRASEHVSDAVTARYSQGSVDPQSPRFVEVSRIFTTDASAYNFADLYRANPTVPGGTPAFGVTRSAETVDWGAYLQLAWRPSANHEVTSTFFHNQSAHDQVKRGIGEAVRSDSGGEFRENYDLLYTERGVSSLQFAGRSNFPTWNDAKLEWRAAFSRSTQEQPDYRSLEFKWSFILQAFDPSGLNNYRYFRALEEDSVDLGVDFTRSLSLAGGRELTLKAGLAQFDGDRTNRERAFVIQSPSARTRAGIESFPGTVGIASQTANAVSFGTVMREISANLNYDGAQTFSAGYVMGDLRLSEQWRMIGGARLERTDILTTPLPTAGVTVLPGALKQTDALPAFALIWSPWDRQNFRFSYGRTLARPTFRELADVVNYEAFTDEFIGGNPRLNMTLIDNLDLRWEWFARRGEVIAASLFYKRLDQPIEQVFSAGRIFPSNVDRGIAYGLEVEARRRLDGMHPALENLSVGFNASLIKSEVTISPAELALIRAVVPGASGKRTLFGQSPFIVNFDATLRVPAWDSQFTAVFGVSGRRLDLVTSGALPDVFEQPAPALDFIWSQRLTSRLKLKFTAKNLLDSAREKTLEHGGTTYFYERYSRGRKFGLSLSYAFE